MDISTEFVRVVAVVVWGSHWSWDISCWYYEQRAHFVSTWTRVESGGAELKKKGMAEADLMCDDALGLAGARTKPVSAPPRKQKREGTTHV